MEPSRLSLQHKIVAIVGLAVSLVLSACGGGDDGTVGDDNVVGAPIVTRAPISGDVIVGQIAGFHVEASGLALVFEWQEQRPGGAWQTSTGTASNQTESSDLLLGPVDIGMDKTLIRSVVSNSAGLATSAEATLGVVWGRTSTLEPNTFDFGPGSEGFGSADGGTPGGGDGEGAGVGGGLGKTIRTRIALQRVADGASLGEALTGATSGLVRVKAGPGAAPLLITLQGGGSASYYDEGKSAMLPLPADAQLHALALAFDQHLGVTVLTEAAYRYAINNYIVDPVAVRNGTVALQRAATPEQIARLTPAQIQLAHDAIRREINNILPTRYQVQSIAALPTPVDPTSGPGSITANRYGTMQAVTGGLALAAGQFNVSLENPALTMARQLADDLTDGVIDGLSLDQRDVFEGPEGPAYGPGSLPGLLEAAADAIFARFGAAPAPTTGMVEPVPYRSAGDSPFRSVSFAYFHLEDWSDRALNVPGVTSSSATLSSSFGGSVIDSVDGDDGTVDGRCDVSSQRCDALWGPGIITLTFDAQVLGVLPDHVGLVFTDAGGGAAVTFEAFDASGASLGTRSVTAGPGVEGDVDEDRFFGVVASQGVQRVEIRADTGGVEIDHLQYGRAGTPALVAVPRLSPTFASATRRSVQQRE